MKFLSTTLALAALASPVLGQGNSQVETKSATYAGNATLIQDAGIYFDQEKNMIVRKRRVPGYTFIIPRGEVEKAKGDEHRRKRALKIVEQRRLEGPEIVLPDTTGTPFFASSGPVKFEVAGLEGASTASLKVSKDGVELEPLDLLSEFFYDSESGVSTPDLEFEKDTEHTYSFQVVVDDEVIEGGSFTYGPEANPSASSRARTGNIQTNSGAADFKEEGEYTEGGDILGATGRIYFSSYGVDYACTGTVIKDNKTGRSLVLTAAHCVFDDIDWVFGANVIFIPNRDSIDMTDMTGDDVHRECSRDICGCWSLSGGVVHDMWADTPWPERLLYDYGFYVVDDVGDHQGTSCGSDALDEAIEEMEFKVGVDLGAQNVHAFGYSLDHNPDFRECADNTEYNQPIDNTDTYWLPGCGLQGGSSGGPWLANFKDGSGDIVSVNSWSYSDVPGMGGPIIDASAARCLVNAARDLDFETLMEEDDGDEGVFVNCHDRPCIPSEEADVRRLRGTEEDKPRRRHRVLCEHKEI